MAAVGYEILKVSYELVEDRGRIEVWNCGTRYLHLTNVHPLEIFADEPWNGIYKCYKCRANYERKQYDNNGIQAWGDNYTPTLDDINLHSDRTTAQIAREGLDQAIERVESTPERTTYTQYGNADFSRLLGRTTWARFRNTVTD